jgi:hypothetical protein
MTPEQMIREWRKGCSCASEQRPEECPACTKALVEALEQALTKITAACLDIAEKDPYYPSEINGDLSCFFCEAWEGQPHSKLCAWAALCEAYKP